MLKQTTRTFGNIITLDHDSVNQDEYLKVIKLIDTQGYEVAGEYLSQWESPEGIPDDEITDELPQSFIYHHTLYLNGGYEYNLVDVRNMGTLSLYRSVLTVED